MSGILSLALDRPQTEQVSTAAQEEREYLMALVMAHHQIDSHFEAWAWPESRYTVH